MHHKSTESALDFQRVGLADGDAIFGQRIFGTRQANDLFQYLHQACEWRQAQIKLFGKHITSPRLTAWYGERPYTYSNLTWPAQPFPQPLLDIKARVEDHSGATFNGVLINLYRDGRDSMGWHSDDEPALGPAPVIASLSFGEARRMAFRRRDDKCQKVTVPLPDDSLLVTRGATQNYWQHAVPKTARAVGPRINLTFRTIY